MTNPSGHSGHPTASSGNASPDGFTPSPVAAKPSAASRIAAAQKLHAQNGEASQGNLPRNSEDSEMDAIAMQAISAVRAGGPVPQAPAKEVIPETVSVAHVPQAAAPEKYMTVELPSQGLAYSDGITSVQIKRFGVPQIGLLHRSRVEGDFRHVIDALGSTLWQRDVRKLTFMDSWFLMYWQRINSYKRVPFTIDWTCNDDKHLHLIDTKQVPADSTERRTALEQSDLTIVNLQPRVNDIADRIEEQYGLRVVPFTVEHYLQHAQFMEADPDAALDAGLSLRYANVLSIQHHGATLKARLAVIEALEDADVLEDLEEFLEACDHGVQEKFQVSCEVCGAKHTIERVLDATNFFPELLRRSIA